MRVPFTTADFLDRAAAVYPQRGGVVDEPGEHQDGGLGTVTYARLAERAAGIVEHCGARVLLVDPEVDAALADVSAEHRFVLGEESDAALLRPDVAPRPWAEPDEDATATINYTSGTTARPKGVQITQRNVWVNGVTFALHVGASDRDVYLHTLPMFHANGVRGCVGARLRSRRPAVGRCSRSARGGLALVSHVGALPDETS